MTQSAISRKLVYASVGLIFFASTCFALPTTSSEPEKIKAVLSEPNKNEASPLDEATIAKPAALSSLSETEKAKLYEAERQRWGDRHLSLGLIDRFGNFLKKEENTSALGLGLMFSQDVDFDHGIDYGFEVLNSNILTLQLAQRNYFTDYERLYLPYWKLGVGTAYLASEGVPTLFDLKKLNAYLSAGLGDLTNDNRKYFVEFGMGYSLIGLQMFISTGFNRNF